MLTRIAITILTATALMSSAPALAQQADQGVVSVRSTTQAQLHWTGRGQVRGGVPVCIASPTGRYELVVGSGSGQGLTGQTALGYVVTFEADGMTQTASLSRSSPTARFQGAVDPARTCDSGANARLIVALDPQAAFAANSGLYADQVNVSIETR